MEIWHAELKEVENLYESLKGKFPDLEKELGQLIRFDDPNVLLLYSRRCLEVIITDLCENELKRPRKTEPLKGIIDKLSKDEKVPSHIITSMDHLNGLATYGTHPKDFDPEQVKPVLNNLFTVLKWYLKYKESLIIGKIKAEEEKTHIRESLTEINKEHGWKERVKPAKFTKQKLLLGIFITITVLVVIVIYAYPKLFKRNILDNLRSSDGRISFVVMPFQNLTNDTTWNIWQNGIQASLITSLSNSEALCIRQFETINSLLKSKGIVDYASIIPPVAINLSKNLDANILINGSIIQSGPTIRVNAQLIDTKTEEIINTFQLDGASENILNMIDSLSIIIRNVFTIKNLEKNMIPVWRHTPSIISPKAYQYYILGDIAFQNADEQTAIEQFSKALSCDTNLILAARKISVAFLNLHDYDEAKKSCLKIYRKKEQLPVIEQIWTDWLYAVLFETPNEQIKYLNQILSIDDKMISGYDLLAWTYFLIHQYNKAIPQYQKALELYEEWDSKSLSSSDYSNLGLLYYKNGQYQKAKRMIKKEKKYSSDDEKSNIILTWLSLKDGDTATANQYIDKIKKSYKENLYSEADILSSLAFWFSFGDIPDKAEEYYRQLLSLEPYSVYTKKDLAYLLIDHNINVNEGIELIDSALRIMGHGRYKDDYLFFHTKGWGLYKLGKYEEALKFLEKSDSLKPIYDYELYLHLEAAKKAVASQKSN